MEASKKNNSQYSKHLKENAHDLRYKMTKAEEGLKNNPPPAPSSGGHVGQSLASSIYSQTKDSYLLKNVSAIETKELGNDLWLVLAGIDSIPPHIALINSGKYYSVTARKVKVGEPIENFLKAISRNALPTIFVKINMRQPSEALGEKLNGIFSKYPTLGNGEHTCHWPIRDFFSLVASADFEKVDLVFELLEELHAKNMLVECRSIYIDGSQQEIELPKYTLGHIREKINSILSLKN